MRTRNLLEIKGGRSVRLKTSLPSVGQLSRICGSPMSRNPMGLHGLLKRYLFIYLLIYSIHNPGCTSRKTFCVCTMMTSNDKKLLNYKVPFNEIDLIQNSVLGEYDAIYRLYNAYSVLN
jgi:hypothetical protein